MAATKSFAVIGLGQFGRALVDELIENGMDVIAIDTSEEAINKISKKLPTAFVADSTNEQALKELGIQDVDAAIVAYGDNKEASILTTEHRTVTGRSLRMARNSISRPHLTVSSYHQHSPAAYLEVTATAYVHTLRLKDSTGGRLSSWYSALRLSIVVLAVIRIA